jgi:PAS domain S-box-containing protein
MASPTTLTHVSTAAFSAALVLLAAVGAIVLLAMRGATAVEPMRAVFIATTGVALLLLATAWAVSRRLVDQYNRAQTLARVGEARLHATLQSCGDALIVADDGGNVTMVNPVAETLTGWAQEQGAGRPLEVVFQLVNETTQEALENPVRQVLREGRTAAVPDHAVLLARDGSERPIDGSAALIRDAHSDTAGAVLVFRDISARRQADQARESVVRAEAARDAALRASEAKDQFLALVSHELRSPLAAIRGWLHLLDNGFVPQSELHGALQRIHRNTRLQERLVSDLLDLSRISAGKLEVIRSPINLVKVAQAAIDACSLLADERGVALVLEQPEPLLLVLGDEQRLIQAVANLTGNGIKFTGAGGSVVVLVERLDNDAAVKVMDSGIGMAPEVLERLFEPFWQPDSSKARKQGGLGLGLAITKHLIEEHDGTIQAASAGPGLGSTFTIRLPLLEAGFAGRDFPALRAPGVKDLAGVRILLVDDDQDARDATQILLQARGAEIQVAGSVQAAIRLLEAAPPTVVVSDIGMPDEDGYSLAREVRERDARTGRRTPMIALTGYASAGDLREALERGFDMHVAKPVDPESLTARITALVRQ